MQVEPDATIDEDTVGAFNRFVRTLRRMPTPAGVTIRITLRTRGG